MKLLKVKIKNFLSLKEEQTLKLNNGITSLIGLNEAGKTSILKAIIKLNGEKIKKEEKNKKLKSNESSITGYFSIGGDEIKNINKGLDPLIQLDESKKYAIEVFVDDEDGVGYNLLYLDEEKKYVSMDSTFLNILNGEIVKNISINDSLEHKKGTYQETIEYLEELIKMDSANTDELSQIKEIAEYLNENKWTESIPDYEFISFSVFRDVLKSKYTIDEVKKEQKVLNILKIAGIDIEQIDKDITENNVFSIQDVENEYAEIATTKFKEIFKQVDDNFKLRIKIDSATRSIYFSTQDKTTDNVSIPIDDRSEGFKWYLSIYLTLYNYIENNDSHNKILLLDEPNLYLHAEAQMDLLERVFKKEFKNIQIIYTTHSPYMIDSANTNSIKIIEKETQTNIYNSAREYALARKDMNDVDALTPVMTALHLNIANELIVNSNNNIIIVEGIQDLYVLKSMIYKLNYTGKFKNIKIIPCFGSEKVTFMFGYLYGLGYKTYILVDNDKAGRRTINEITNREPDNFLKNYLFTYSLSFESKSDNIQKKIQDVLLENLISKNDWSNIFKEKNTILYKNVYDNIDNLNFEKETIDNFKNLFDNIIKNMEE